MKIQGGSTVIHIISAYHPVHSHGPETVFAQHDCHLSQHSTHDPRKDILQQLHALVTNWMTEGEEIILCMDANDDTRQHRIKQFSNSLGLSDTILSRHTNPPATCDKNNQRQPINTILITPGLNPVSSGYLPYGKGCPSDHRVLWFDIIKDTFLGQSPKLATPKPRRLKASDPLLVDNISKCSNLS